MTNATSLRRYLSSALAAIVAGTIATFASAASAFQIVPISQDFDPSGRGVNQVFQIENDRDEAVTVTINMTKRLIDIDGRETMPDTEDFSLFPTEIILQPKTSRVVRVKWLGDPVPATELAYRIIAEETPLNTRRDTPGASVFLTVRYVGSIYVVPKNAKSNVVVASARPVVDSQGTPMLEVILENKGNRHALLDEPSLTLTSGGVSKAVEKATLEKVLAGENILAGGLRRFLLPMPAGLPAGSLAGDFKYTAQ